MGCVIPYFYEYTVHAVCNNSSSVSAFTCSLFDLSTQLCAFNTVIKIDTNIALAFLYVPCFAQTG